MIQEEKSAIYRKPRRKPIINKELISKSKTLHKTKVQISRQVKEINGN